MSVKERLKKCMWLALVILMSVLMIQSGKDALDNIWIEGDPTFHYYVALSWEILKGIAVILPVWLLSLLGLARSCFGENWFPFAQKIPIRVTKMILVTAMILLIGVTVAEKVYSEYTTVPFWVRDTVKESFGRWQGAFIWMLFYGMLLYIEQWCIRRNDSRQMIRKKQLWVVVTIMLAYLILVFIGGVDLWYTPLERVGDLNSLEDYDLWWFSLYSAVFVLPLWLLSMRKMIRLFKNNEQWLTISTTVPKKFTALTALALTGLMVWQIQESRSDRARIPSFDVPEYLEAAATSHTFQALICGLALFYTLCLLVKQIRLTHKVKHRV